MVRSRIAIGEIYNLFQQILANYFAIIYARKWNQNKRQVKKGNNIYVKI